MKFFENKTDKFNISLALDGDYTLTEYTLDKSTSALHNWVKMGAPKYLSREEIKNLKEQSQPIQETRETKNFNINISLEPHEVKMFIIENK